jgi:hypothetical protein
LLFLCRIPIASQHQFTDKLYCVAQRNSEGEELELIKRIELECGVFEDARTRMIFAENLRNLPKNAGRNEKVTNGNQNE